MSETPGFVPAEAMTPPKADGEPTTLSIHSLAHEAAGDPAKAKELLAKIDDVALLQETLRNRQAYLTDMAEEFKTPAEGDATVAGSLREQHCVYNALVERVNELTADSETDESAQALYDRLMDGSGSERIDEITDADLLNGVLAIAEAHVADMVMNTATQGVIPTLPSRNQLDTNRDMPLAQAIRNRLQELEQQA